MIGGISYYELIGYIASVVVAISLSMSSILKLRWLNLFGSSFFGLYGFLIGAMPVAFLNTYIAIINIVYLIGLYRKKDAFSLIKLGGDDAVLVNFCEFYKKDIAIFFPDFAPPINNTNTINWLIMRSANIAGFLMGKKNGTELAIELDYVAPQYRDLKPAKFIYEQNCPLLIAEGIKLLTAKTQNPEHAKYLTKMGFSLVKNENAQAHFSKTI